MSVYPGAAFPFFPSFFLPHPPSPFVKRSPRPLSKAFERALLLVKDGEEEKKRRRGRKGGGGRRREKEAGRRWRRPTKGPRARKGKFMYVPWRNSAICVEFLLAHQFFGFPKDLGQADSCEKPSRPFSLPGLSSPNDPRFLAELRATFRETNSTPNSTANSTLLTYIITSIAYSSNRFEMINIIWTNETKK